MTLARVMIDVKNNNRGKREELQNAQGGNSKQKIRPDSRQGEVKKNRLERAGGVGPSTRLLAAQQTPLAKANQPWGSQLQAR